MNQIKKQRVINFSLLWMRIKGLLTQLKALIYLFILALIIVVVNRYILDSKYVNHQLILQYLNALKLVILLILASFILKRFFPELIDRAKEFGPGGAKFYPKQQQVTADEEEQLQKVAEKETRGEVDIATDAGRTEVLKDGTVKWLLEKIYRLIFGTQIEVLYRLSSFPSGLSENELNDIFVKHRGSTPNAFQNFIEFIRYLSNYGLVSYDATTKIYKLTDAGRLFLDYLNQEGLNASMRVW